MNGGAAPAPGKPLKQKAKTKMSARDITSIIVAVITVVGSIFAAKIAAKSEVTNAGSQISALNDQASSIKAKINGIAVPGTIVAYAGPLDEASLTNQGWLPCDGRPVRIADYKDLYKQIKSTWGNGDGVFTFNLPDLRGVFLRGVNGIRTDPFSDPDATNRVSLLDGGNKKNNVGSYQPDEFKSHTHDIKVYIKELGGNINGAGRGNVDGTNSNMVLANGGNETRPKNAYVYYIIKY
jgi:hypothetical protein